MGTRIRVSFLCSAGLLCFATAASAGNPTPTLANVVGVYHGQWYNDTFDSFAPAHIRIEAAGGTATLGVDLDTGPNGCVFGVCADPSEAVFTGTVGSQSLSKSDDSLFGDVNCTGHPADFLCTGSMISPSVLSGSITGNITGDVLHAIYDLSLFGGSMATGTLDATKVPEPGIVPAAVGALGSLLALARRGAGTRS